MPSSKITLVQMKIDNRDPERNLLKIFEFLKNEVSHLYIFPELALTGYRDDLNKLVTSGWYQEALRELQGLAETKTFILGMPLYKEGKLVNAAVLFSSKGSKVLAEKVALFPGLDDRVSFSIGEKREIFNLGEYPLAVFICFELRATELLRRYALQGLSGLIFLAQWPKSRIHHWETLLQARAIENQIPILGVNAIGSVFGLELGGRTSAFSADGSTIATTSRNEEALNLFLNLEFKHLPYPRRSIYQEPTKVVSLPQVLSILSGRRSCGERIVFTNGCFDLLHAGHVDYLQRARSLGDVLVVGLNSDLSVKKIKGSSRPINQQGYRAKVLAGLSCVDYVVIFDEETPENLIKAIQPDFLVKGADWPEDRIAGADLVKSYGGKVVRLSFQYNVSTTKLIESIRKGLG